MKNLRTLGLTFGLMFIVSCAHNHKCHQARACKDGVCKIDKSCCGNKCKKCEGKDSCKTANCDMSKKS